MKCKYCNRNIDVDCMNTRDMEENAIAGDRECFFQLASLGGGERGLNSIIAIIEKKKLHFVTFHSPGTFVNEQTKLAIDSWDVDKAIEMSKNIKERHDALPFGFIFSTTINNETKTSNFYYLGGKIETIEEIEARNDPEEEILLSNMKCNGIKKVLINTNSWKFTARLNESDIILNIAELKLVS